MITARIYPMPGRIRSYTVRKEDYYTIVVNSNLSEEARLEAYRHEVDHIERGDFDKVNADLIEIHAHREETP